MSDKLRQTVNKVVLTGELAELEVKKGTTKKDGIPYISVKGAVQFGDSKVCTKRFEKYCQEYRLKDGDKKENKAYPNIVAWANSAVSKASKKADQEVTKVSIQGSFKTNDYVNSEEKLIESTTIDAAFFNDNDNGDYAGNADIEGYILSIKEETKGEDQTPTGRLRVTVVSTDFFGNVIPVKNIIVPKELKDAFEDNYEETQTAKLYIDFVATKSEEPKKQKGGIGVQRTTDAKSYVEMILTGADPAIDEDEDNALSTEAVKIGMKERKAALDKLLEEGYKGSSSTNKPINTTLSNDISENDLPF